MSAAGPAGEKRAARIPARGIRSRALAGPLPLLALFVALAMRLFVPAGFMWAPAADGTPRLILCPGTVPAPVHDMAAMPGMAAMHHAEATGDHGHSHRDSSAGDHECAFAAFGGALDTADFGFEAAAALIAAVYLPVAILADLVPGRGLAAPPPPLRGPPATF